MLWSLLFHSLSAVELAARIRAARVLRCLLFRKSGAVEIALSQLEAAVLAARMLAALVLLCLLSHRSSAVVLALSQLECC